MSGWRRHLEWYLAVPAGIGAFFGFWFVLQIYSPAALALASLVGIFIWWIVRLRLGKLVKNAVLIQLAVVTFGLILSFHQISQIGLQPRLDLNCKELAYEYPNLWAPGPVVLYPPNQSYRQVDQPILLVITNRGRAAAAPRLYVSVDDPFLISIFGIRTNGDWWSWVKEPVSRELTPKQFSWVAGENYRRATLTLSEILPGKALEAYFLLVAPLEPSREAKTSIRARLTGINRPVEKEFKIMWEQGEMKCGS